MIKQSDIVSAARGLIGAPYKHQGRSYRGVDCAGLLIVISEELGFGYQEHIFHYNKNPETYCYCTEDGKTVSLRQEMDRVLISISAEDMRPGDFILFGFRGLAQHVSVVGDYRYGGLSLIHFHYWMKKVVEQRFIKTWEKYIIRVYRVPDIEEDM